MSEIFLKYTGSIQSKLDNFEKYVRRQTLARFLARYELFKLQAGIKGCIIECGVQNGGGLFAWAKLSAALEPYALDRRIIGFDTFAGFPGVNEKDSPAEENLDLKIGGLTAPPDILEELTELIQEYDGNRFLNQYQKIFLVQGDATQTIPQFMKENQYILISLLFLDFDLYEPTKVALDHFLPRMPQGAVLAFDELNNPWWPGETRALLESLDLKVNRIQRFPFDPNISFIIL
jgi:hypothetical protein